MPVYATSIAPAVDGSAENQGAPHDAGLATFSIGQLAEEFGVTLRALRFYECRGLLSPRRSGTSRHYDQSDRDRLAYVLKAKQLGFTLREIEELIAGEAGRAGIDVHLSRRQCTEQIVLLERQKCAIETALAELRRTYSTHYVQELEEAAPSGK